MAPNTDVPTRSVRVQADDFIFWDPCAGLQPIIVKAPETLLMGQAVVAAISLGVLALLGVLLPPG